MAANPAAPLSPPHAPLLAKNHNNNSNNNHSSAAGALSEEGLFEMRLLRQKVSALEGEVNVLKRELDAARSSNTGGARARRYPSPVVVPARGVAASGNAGADSLQHQQQHVAAVPATEPLSYGMQQAVNGMSLDQRLAALQDLQYHMSMAKAITDNVHVAVLAAPRADALNLSPPRYPTSTATSAVPSSGGRKRVGDPYSPTQQQMIEHAVREAQEALRQPEYPTPYGVGIGKYNTIQRPNQATYWTAALTGPAPLHPLPARRL